MASLEGRQPHDGTSTLVLLLTIDSLRRDRVGCFSGGPTLTPYIDSLAREGLQFDLAISHGGETPESFPSMMCSVPPPITMVDRSVKGKMTLARVLKESGFSTAGFHPNPYLTTEFGYEEGFDTFYEGAWSRMPSGIQAIRRTTNQLLFNKGPITDCWSTARMAKAWARNASGDAFLWVHFMDVHVPYLPRTSTTGLGRSMTNRALMAMVLSSDELNRYTRPTERTRRAIVEAYDACVGEVDRCISALVPELVKSFSRSLVIVTSDHGESFWEHGFHGHSGVYDEVARVPLVVRGTGIRPERSSRIVALSDVMPTALEYAGVGPQPSYGYSLFGGSQPEDRLVASSSIVPKLRRRTIGIRSASTKLIRQDSVESGKVEFERFFDLTEDPLESRDVLSSRGDQAKAARQEFDRLYSASSGTPAFSEEEEGEIMERLRALGYA